MKAVGYFQSRSIDHPESLIDLTVPAPRPGERDLLVAVQAVSVNPVDTKVRASRAAAGDGAPVVLGWDAVGTVLEVGSAVEGFAPGDRVWYAGDITRQGSNAQQQVVDARIVSRAPSSLSDAQAAAMPLTVITAWELLFDRLQVPRADALSASPATLLITGGAGGVGSILIQLARRLTGLTVVVTASRPETRQWCLDMGAHHVIDHQEALGPQWALLGDLPPVRYVASLTHTGRHYAALIDLLAPQGRLGLIDDFDAQAVDIRLAKPKSISLHWEMMFARSRFQTDDMAEQGRLLAEVARLMDARTLRTTLAEVMGPIDAATLRQAHARLESGTMLGKLVLEGFGS
ncbi:MAG: zinc-binding alcohol dehydrogenase family protein [Rubrivivax sp.]|nr:MAG: zinc-binding alcohol dehydrogenase family protein [Rubrivivax sp.]